MKKATTVDQLCGSLPQEWKLMLKQIRECSFEDKPDYEFFTKHFAKLGGKPGSTDAFNWGDKTTKKVCGWYRILCGYICGCIRKRN